MEKFAQLGSVLLEPLRSIPTLPVLDGFPSLGKDLFRFCDKLDAFLLIEALEPVRARLGLDVLWCNSDAEGLVEGVLVLVLV